MRKRQIYCWLRRSELLKIFCRIKARLDSQKYLGIDSGLCNVFCIFSGTKEFLKTLMMAWNGMVCISHPALARVAMLVWGMGGQRVTSAGNTDKALLAETSQRFHSSSFQIIA